MSKVTLQGYIVVPDADLAAVQAELPKHIELTQQEEGCVVFEVTQDSERRNIFHVYEEFVDRGAFEAHQARAQSSNWGRATVDVKRHYETSEGN